MGKMGAMLRRVAMPAHATVGPCAGSFGPLIRAALVVAVLAVVREVLLDRAPQRALQGDEPVIGSLDTWPTVPRKPGS